MIYLSSAPECGKSGGQEVATNEPLTLIAIQDLTQGPRPLPQYNADSQSAQAERVDNWKSVGEIAAELARRAAEKAGPSNDG